MADSRNRGNERMLYIPPAQRRRQQQQQQQQQRQQQQQQMMVMKREREQREREALFHQFQQHQQLQMMTATRRQYEEQRRQWLLQQHQLQQMMMVEEAQMGLSEVAPGAGEMVAKEEKIRSYLDRLVETVTPHVPAQLIPQPRRNGKEVHGEGDMVSYYNLDDLWECYKEWSAYGAGVDMKLSNDEDATQYYVPSLSMIQIYVDPTRPKMHGVDMISQKLSQFNMTQRSGERLDSGGELIFQYQEQDPPHQRKPFFDKISEFAEIKKLRSCDILPSSWISVAWYPIYRIPSGPSLKSVEASFLTFHHLSTLPISGRSVFAATSSSKLPLPVFGLASYKLTSPLMTLTDNDQKLSESLFLSAENWIKRLQVYHPDFNFFLRNRLGTRR